MFPQFLASVEYVAFMPFVVAIVAIIMGFWYSFNKKRLEHQQIMTAIEKGIPLSELRPLTKNVDVRIGNTTDGASWIRSLSWGIAFLTIGLGMTIILLYVVSSFHSQNGNNVINARFFILPLVFFAIGLAGIISGILRRKTEKAIAAEKSSLDANKGS